MVSDIFTSAPWIWHMNNEHLSSSSIHGDVHPGVALQDCETKVAVFNDGWIRVADGPDLTGCKKMTLYIRMYDPEGKWNAPILALDDPATSPVLYGTNDRLEYNWNTTPLKDRVIPGWEIPEYASEDYKNGVLKIGAPAELIGSTDWHDVIIRFNEANLEMFVDGVMVDEEWPHGGLESFKPPFLIGAGYIDDELQSGFNGQIERIAIWDQALTNEEITELCGGKDETARREIEMFGKKHESIQFWKPLGYNAFAGDCMPFYHDGVFHLFYLFDRRHHASKWGLGAHQYAHVTSSDLIHWEHQPMALPLIRQWECSMGTGDIIWHDGVYTIFYTDCGGRCEFSDKPQTGDQILTATSKDGIHFTKDLKPIMPGGDCKVSRDPVTGEFHLIRYGTNLLISDDLVNWTEQPGEVVEIKENTSAECPNQFEWNGWFYFLLGRTALWKSRSSKGPWEEIDPVVYDGMLVPKVASFNDNRRILAGSLCIAGWGGSLVLRELIQMSDGSLCMKWLEELTPTTGVKITPLFESVRSDATGDSTMVSLTSTKETAIATLTGIPQDCMITMEILPRVGVNKYGVCMRGSGNYEDGAELRFEPIESKAQWGRPSSGELAEIAGREMAVGENYRAGIYEDLNRPITLRIIVKGSIIDTEINGRQTLISRWNPVPNGDKLFLFCENGSVEFKNIEIHTLCDE